MKTKYPHVSCMLWKALYLFSSQDEWLVSKLFGCLCERYAAQPQGFIYMGAEDP